MEFFQKNAEAKQRNKPILGLDLNSTLALKGPIEQLEELFVGEYHRGEQKLASLLRNTDSTSITTMYSEVGPMYFSSQGTSRTLDHCVGSVGVHHVVEECRVLWKTARRLQIIPAGQPRDYMPILLSLRYTLQPRRTEAADDCRLSPEW